GTRGRAVDGGDERFLTAHGGKHPSPNPCERIEALAEALVRQRRWLGEIETGAESAARTRNHDDAHAIIARRLIERMRQLVGEPRIHRVESLWSIQRDRTHATTRRRNDDMVVSHE